MAKRVQRIGHETATAAVFTGLEREITVDLGKKSVRVHDGLTPGGVIVAREDLSTSPVAIGGVSSGKMSANQATELAAATSQNLAQDTRMDAIDIVDVNQNTRLDTMDTLNTAQDTRMDAMDLVNTNQDALNVTQNGRLDTTETDTGINTGNVAILQSGILATILTTGTATAYLATVGISAYVIGTVYKVRIHASNTGAATIALDGLVATAIVYKTGFTLFAGEMPTSHIAELYYDGTDFILLNPSEVVTETNLTATAGSGTLTVWTSRNKLISTLKGTTCHIQADINFSAVSTPSGTCTFNSLLYPGAILPQISGTTYYEVYYEGLASPSTLGLTAIIQPASTAILMYDRNTLTHDPSNVADKFSTITTLKFNFTYKVR